MQLVHKRRQISSAGLTWSSDLLSTVPSTRPRDPGSVSTSESGVDAVAFQRQGQPGVRRTVPRRGGPTQAGIRLGGRDAFGGSAGCAPPLSYYSSLPSYVTGPNAWSAYMSS